MIQKWYSDVCKACFALHIAQLQISHEIRIKRKRIEEEQNKYFEIFQIESKLFDPLAVCETKTCKVHQSPQRVDSLIRFYCRRKLGASN